MLVLVDLLRMRDRVSLLGSDEVGCCIRISLRVKRFPKWR